MVGGAESGSLVLMEKDQNNELTTCSIVGTPPTLNGP